MSINTRVRTTNKEEGLSELQRRRLDAYFSSLEQQPAHNEKVTQWLAVANTTGQGNAYTHQEDEPAGRYHDAIASQVQDQERKRGDNRDRG